MADIITIIGVDLELRQITELRFAVIVTDLN